MRMNYGASCTDRGLEASAELRFGVRSAPYLADHGFQDMVVLPGTIYLAAALCMEHELSGRDPLVISNVTFHNPILISTEDTVVELEVRGHGQRGVEYRFYEAGVEHGKDGSRGRQFAASLEIDRNVEIRQAAEAKGFSIDAFQAQSDFKVDSGRFYERLRENGNQYGRRFQNVSAIWRSGNQFLGKLHVPRPDAQKEAHYLQAAVLDSMIQLLAPFVMDQGKTLSLRSIEKLELKNLNFPETLWGHATMPARDQLDPKSLTGNVRVFDQAGRPYLELSGVSFTLLDRAVTTEGQTAANLVMAANFTAEPVEDSLKFWGGHFNVPIHIEFAPYNQIFQELLDSGSAFRKNCNGANVILLSLEAWAVKNQGVGLTLDQQRAEQCFGTRPRYVLPNGLEILDLNRYETDHLYKEIFEDRCYLKHGIRLRDGDTVVDIGANIGLFSLFVMSCCANPKLYAFEPAPVAYELLKANGNAYGSYFQAVNAGVADKTKLATFTFYQNSSVFSGFHPDETEDRQAIQRIVQNILDNEKVANESVEQYVDELTANRLRRSTHQCQLTSVSEIMREHRIDSIDLLKVDAEKSEWEILQGIDEGDWPKIAQIVMEIHDRTGEAVKRIQELLKDKGYDCAVEHETLLRHSGLFNLYATRKEDGPESASDSGPLGTLAMAMGQTNQKAASLARNIRDFCNALQSFMNQTSVPLVLCLCPLSPTAETDAELRTALNNAEQTLLSEAGKIANVHTLNSSAVLRHYPMREYYDPYGHDLGHIPYTAECYAAIGTALVRAIFNLKGNRFKAIVLDCDNTLWKGICGEDGPVGIEITEDHRTLQQFMLGQMNAGMLLCLCSKNNEKDVLDVLDQQPDMVLKREHLVAWRINWNSKSENIKSLAQELDLGLDSFIFIDDSALECADVRINCPEVLTLQLPRSPEMFPLFLNHIWAFDRARSTDEDKNRTRMYRENTQRRSLREQSFSLKDFVEELQLHVEVVEATEDQLGRVSQLTFRTNQFNFTGIRRSENEIKAFLKDEAAHCLVVRVADRFGDYGLVGVVLYKAQTDRYQVDTLLLSCRVLGRGVEHALVSQLGWRALKDGKQFVELTCLPTQKNWPARQFVTSIGGPHLDERSASWTVPAERLTRIEYDPDGKISPRHELPSDLTSEKLLPNHGLEFGGAGHGERLQWIAENLYDIERLTNAIQGHRIGKQAFVDPADLTSGDTLHRRLLDIWRRVLGRPQIGPNDNFLEAGGTSLRAVQVIALIKKELKQSLSIVSLFECPTVALLCSRLSTAPGEVRTETTTAAAAQRGQQRRYSTMRQKASKDDL